MECTGKAARPNRTSAMGDTSSVCREPRRLPFAPRRRRFPLTARPGLGPVNRHIQSGGGQVAPPATTSGPADSGRDWSNVAAALQNSGVSFHHREQSGIHKEPLKSYRRIATGRSRQPGHHSGWDAGIRTSGMARTVGRGKAQRIPPLAHPASMFCLA